MSDGTDVVARLEKLMGSFDAPDDSGIFGASRNAILALSDEITRLREALALVGHGIYAAPTIDSKAANTYAQIVARMREIARAALSPATEPK